jgi:hypothetical protein
MVPLTQWEKDGEEENEGEMQGAIHTYTLALPTLRRTLLLSLRRVGSSLAAAVGGTAQSSPLAPVQKAATNIHTNLLELQLAFQEWCLFVGEALPELVLVGKEGEGVEVLRAVLEEECLCLSAAFGLNDDSRRRGGEEEEEEQEQEPPIAPPPSSDTTTHTQTYTRRLKHRLQGLGHRLALERAKVESRLARVFLQQCAVADLLAAVEAQEEGEEREERDVKESRIDDQCLYKKLEGLRERMEAGVQEEEVVVIEEMMACLVRPGGGEKEEEGARKKEVEEEEVVMVEDGGGNEDAVGKERQEKNETQCEYATVGKENTSKEKEEEVEEVLLEVFEGLSSSSSSSVSAHRGARATAAAAAVAAAVHHQHDALMNELGHLLTGRRKQQQHQHRQVKVNGALVALRDEEELGEEEEEERVVVAGGDKAKEQEGPSSPVEMGLGMGSSLLAALLQQENKRREKEEEEGNVLIFDGDGEGEEEVEE